MNKALIVSESEFSLNLKEQLNDFRIFSVSSILNAEDYLEVETFELISIFCDQIIADHLQFIEQLLSSTDSLICIQSKSIPASSKTELEQKGIFIFDNDFQFEQFIPNLRIILKNKERFLNHQKFSSSQKKSYEQNILSRAKYILMTNLQMTESQAHKFIEQQSMNLCQSRITTAESILKTYEN